MSIREWFRVLAVLIFACGFSCLAKEANPKYWTSSFLMLSSEGYFSHIGVIIIIVGIVLFGVSFIGDRD
jgi:hypothetical protein